MAYNGKRLHKSESDKKLCGVCGGIAEYFDIDPTLVRLAWIIFCLAGGSGVLGYIIAALVMPEDPTVNSKRSKKEAASRYGAPLLRDGASCGRG